MEVKRDRKDSNYIAQEDEISALEAIYGDEVTKTESSVTIELYATNDVKKEHAIHLQFQLPPEYPSKSSVTFAISAPWMPRDRKVILTDELKNIQEVNHGEPVIYLMIERARDILSTTHEELKSSSNFTVTNLTSTLKNQSLNSEECKSQIDNSIEIFTGQPFVDRKSTFQAHLAKVKSVDDVNKVKNILLSNKKIASATHNISAYRISGPSVVIQDCDDDGETAAGSRLLHLLVILDVKDVLIVVSRWFGGIQLGPDRFKHINNVARDILEVNNLVKKETVSSGKEKKKKK